MNPFFEYLIKSTFSLTLFYIVFKLAVSRDKMHSVNRFVLLSILFFSAIIPFADVPAFREIPVIPKVEVFREFVAPPVFTAEPVFESIQPVRETKGININPYLLFYILIISALFIRLLVSAIRVMQIINRAEKRQFRKIVLAVVKDLIQPFTFLNRIVLSEKDFTENKDIIVAHEHAHIKKMHAIDLMVCEVFTVLHFFNPFMWLLRHDLKLIHEYQADQAVLKKGIDAKKYQLLVLQKSVGERRFAMANYFSQKPILKRLKMMQKKNKNRWKGMKLIIFIPIILLLLQAFARPEMVVEKASEFVPSIIQKDSSEIWLDNWLIDNLGIINGEMITKEVEIKPPPPGQSQLDIPKYKKSRDGHPIPSANIFPILINSKNQILAASTLVNEKELIAGVEQFLRGNHPFNIANPSPEFVKRDLPFVGSVKVTKGVMLVRYDNDTDKNIIDNLLRNIGQSYLTMREETAKDKFGQDYFSLDSEKKSVVNQMVPIRVSIMEHKIIKPPPPPPQFVVKLYNDKITLWNEEIAMSEVSGKAKAYVSRFGKDGVVRVEIENNINAERIHLLKEELRKAGALNINLRTMK